MNSGMSAMASSGSGLDASCYQQRRDSFTRSLLHFHETRGTPFKRLPELGGRDVDLFKLYNMVTERGGWVKVNRTNGWDDLISEFNLPKHVTNAGAAIKQIYLRYLDRYEKVHFLGENGDRNDDEEDVESRHRRWSARSMHTVSLTYNMHQHNVSESVRRMSGMSTDLYRGSEFDRVALSLLSPLPNEQDFAINVCTLLASEGKHALRLEKCPRIIDYLLAHAGVYNHENLRKLFEEIYGQIRRQAIKTFWDDVLESREFADLTDETKFRRRRLPRLSLDKRAASPEYVPEASETPSAGPPAPSPVVTIEDCTGPASSQPSTDSGIDLPPIASTEVPSQPLEQPETPADLNQRPAPCEDGSTPMDVRLEGEPAIPAEKMELEGEVQAEVVPAPPTETPEEIEERKQKEREEQNRLRLEEEERLRREEKEADHFEVLRRTDEARRSGKPMKVPSVAPVSNRRSNRSGLHGRISIDDTDKQFFNLGRENGTRDIIGQRVLQVANILRNETFCEETVALMARHQTFIRFLLLCANSRWSNLHQLGMDMLGNIAPELVLEDPALERLTQIMFNSVSRGIRHSDRFVVISSLEFLNKICQRDEHEEIVTRAVDQAVYEQVCHMLSLHDIMVLLYTLECLYSLSSLGERPCNYICRARGAIQMLLSLITVEAQSYGPKACIQMKVIETVSGGAALPPSTTSLAPATPNVTVQHKIVTPQLMRAPSPKTVVGMPMGAVATPVAIPNPSQFVNMGPMNSAPVAVTAQPPTPAPVPISPSVQQQHAHQQTVMENEQFAQAWVRANFELSAGGKVEQPDMYRKYVDWCTSQNRKGVITAMHFPRIVRSVFGGTVGPKVQQTTAGSNAVTPAYEGIQVREVPLTINVKLVPGTEVPPATPPVRRRSSNLANVSPILKAQLVSSPHPSQVSEGSPSPTPAPVPNHEPPSTQADGDNTSLIKSLLASKVTQRQAQAKLLQAQQLQTGQPTVPSAATPAKQMAKVIRTNGIVQEMLIDSNHLPPTEKSKKEPPQPPPAVKLVRADAEDSDSMASSSRDYPNMTGVTQSSNEDNESSLTSFEGIFLNGIDLEAALTEGSKLAKMKSTEAEAPAKPKSQMLADLLDKKDSCVMNGVIGEKGLELVEKAISSNNGVPECSENRTSSVKVCGKTEETTAKRSAVNDASGDVTEAKRPKLNTVENNVDKDEVDHKTEEGKQSNGEEEVRASSKAANLFAALAAEALEDEEVEVVPQEEVTAVGAATSSQPEVTPKPVSAPAKSAPAPVPALVNSGFVRPMIIGQDGAPLLVTGVGGQRQIIMTAPPQAGQVLISAGGQITLQKPASGNNAPSVVSRIVQSGTQQYIVSGNSAQPVILPQGAGVQGQTVLLTAPGGQQQGAAKTIIILQPQASAPGQPQQHQKLVLTQSGGVMVGRPVSESPPALVSQRDVPEVSITQNGGQLHVVRAGGPVVAGAVPSSSAATNGVQQIQVISSGVQNNAPILVDKSSPALSDHSVYLCEWRSCMRSFKAASEVYLHVCSCHCPVDPEQETQCLWGRCDGMKRKRFSLMTHLYDRHCNSEILNVMAMRRRQLSSSGKTEIPAPSPAPAHPGYAPNAAFHAIKRHAGEFANPKELMVQQQQLQQSVVQPRMGAGLKPPPAPPTPPSSASLLAKVTAVPVVVKDDNEGPVTKSIRLTASLILRNLIIYSAIGRRFLKGYEPHLANIALSNVESSRTIAQVLADLNDSGSTGT